MSTTQNSSHWMTINGDMIVNFANVAMDKHYNMLVSKVRMQQKSLLTPQRTHFTDVTMKMHCTNSDPTNKEAKKLITKFYKSHNYTQHTKR